MYAYKRQNHQVTIQKLLDLTKFERSQLISRISTYFIGEFEAISEKAYEYIPDDEDDNEEESESDSEIGVRKRTWRGLKLVPPHATVDDTSESEASASERGSPVQEDTNCKFFFYFYFVLVL